MYLFLPIVCGIHGLSREMLVFPIHIGDQPIRETKGGPLFKMVSHSLSMLSVTAHFPSNLVHSLKHVENISMMDRSYLDVILVRSLS